MWVLTERSLAVEEILSQSKTGSNVKKNMWAWRHGFLILGCIQFQQQRLRRC